MRKLLFALVMILALAAGPAAVPVEACPMCAEANKTEENRPRAYMYSILFMLSMPALIFTGFGVGFYRLHRKQAAQDEHDRLIEENETLH